MAISRKSTEPTGVTNTSGQPEIVLEIEGLTISMTPPARDQAPRDQVDRDHAEPAGPDQAQPAADETDR